MLRKFFPTLFILLLIMTPKIDSQNFHSNFNVSGGWDEDFDLWSWYKDSRPFIEVNFGFGNVKHKKFMGDFAKVGLGELKIGYSTLDIASEDYIMELDDKYIFGSSITNKLRSGDATAGEVESETYRFGFGRRDGYGYRVGKVIIVPYNQGAFVWTRIDFNPQGGLIPADTEILNRYNKAFRFGTLSEAGLKIEIASLISLNTSYEAAIIFPRHLFWKQAASFMLEGIGYVSIDYFVNEVMDSTPAAAPIINFLLKNGFAYGVYLLEREKMNWPFETETPLTMETFKVGLTFTF